MKYTKSYVKSVIYIMFSKIIIKILDNKSFLIL